MVNIYARGIILDDSRAELGQGARHDAPDQHREVPGGLPARQPVDLFGVCQNRPGQRRHRRCGQIRAGQFGSLDFNGHGPGQNWQAEDSQKAKAERTANHTILRAEYKMTLAQMSRSEKTIKPAMNRRMRELETFMA